LEPLSLSHTRENVRLSVPVLAAPPPRGVALTPAGSEMLSGPAAAAWITRRINEASRIKKEIVGNAENTVESNAELSDIRAHELEAKL
jgi:hypothetical protein